MFIVIRKNDPTYPYFRGYEKRLSPSLIAKTEPAFSAWLSAAKQYKSRRHATSIAKELSECGFDCEVLEI